MGLLGGGASVATAPDGHNLAQLLQALQRHGIGGDAARALAPLLSRARGARRQRISGVRSFEGTGR